MMTVETPVESIADLFSDGLVKYKIDRYERNIAARLLTPSNISFSYYQRREQAYIREHKTINGREFSIIRLAGYSPLFLPKAKDSVWLISNQTSNIMIKWRLIFCWKSSFSTAKFHICYEYLGVKTAEMDKDSFLTFFPKAIEKTYGGYSE